MALSLESANLVRQKAYNYVRGMGTNQSSKSRFHTAALREFFNQHADKGNTNLQFIPFSEAEADAADGTSKADAANKLYVVYVKKLNETTVNYFKVFDDATNDTTAGDQRIVIELDAAKQEVLLVYPDGVSNTAGIVVTQHTTSEGTTDGSNGGDGFLIIGAA